MASVVKKCTCKHTFQDNQYGQGMRLFNETGGGKVRCTVCKAEVGK